VYAISEGIGHQARVQRGQLEAVFCGLMGLPEVRGEDAVEPARTIDERRRLHGTETGRHRDRPALAERAGPAESREVREEAATLRAESRQARRQSQAVRQEQAAILQAVKAIAAEVPDASGFATAAAVDAEFRTAASGTTGVEVIVELSDPRTAPLPRWPSASAGAARLTRSSCDSGAPRGRLSPPRRVV
jgi:hypothetical protein